jgi:hypothetical protein
MRREVPLGIAAIVGFGIILQYFLVDTTLRTMATHAQNWGTIIAAMATGLAVINLVRIHVMRINRKSTDWPYSIALVATIAVFGGLGLYNNTDKTFLFLRNNLMVPLGSATFSLLVFFIASASYRAFRVRNLDATLLLVAGIILMLGRAPLGEVISKQFPQWADWLMKVPNLAANRGIMIGAAVGVIATGLRTLVGIDRGYLGGGQ